MNLSKINVPEFVNQLNEYSNFQLQNIEDITRILEIVKKNELYNTFEDILFSAKAFNGLIRIIRNSENKFDDDYFNKLKSEIKNNTEIVVNGLKIISEKGGTFIAEIFNEKYFLLTTECINNLSLLCSDLEYIKLYNNDNK